MYCGDAAYALHGALHMFCIYITPDTNHLHILYKQRRNSEIQEYDNTKYYPVISKHFEIMVLNILHQELDCKNGHSE